MKNEIDTLEIIDKEFIVTLKGFSDWGMTTYVELIYANGEDNDTVIHRGDKSKCMTIVIRDKLMNDTQFDNVCEKIRATIVKIRNQHGTR